MLIPSSFLSSNTIFELSTLSNLGSLVLLGSLTPNEHEILSAAEFSSESFPALRKLEFRTDTFEVVSYLWNTPLVSHLTHIVLIVEDIDEDDVMTLFKLVVSQSPKLDSLSLSYPFINFELSLLNTLSPLKLRKLALSSQMDAPYKVRPNVLRHIGSLWPELEYLSAPFHIDFSDLLSIALYLPNLRHLAIGFPFEDIEIFTLPEETLWKALPKHELVLWVQTIDYVTFDDEWMTSEKGSVIEKLARLLALAWPYMRMFIRGHSKYYESMRRDIAMRSYDIFESDKPIDDMDDADGLIAANYMWAYIDETSSATQIYLHTFE
ncbi:hypothetical protein RhiJN_15233 [Ceratobasidium sp. AG-Ba]|nr:hypothetical protein RhiJN_15233 [Ceratobasidium sp. AG-Ba]